MPTHGLIISKLAIRVLANDETVMALICLKVTPSLLCDLMAKRQVSLPEDTEGRAARWALFPRSPSPVFMGLTNRYPTKGDVASNDMPSPTARENNTLRINARGR